jgi:hypothetical protein
MKETQLPLIGSPVNTPKKSLVRQRSHSFDHSDLFRRTSGGANSSGSRSNDHDTRITDTDTDSLDDGALLHSQSGSRLEIGDSCNYHLLPQLAANAKMSFVRVYVTVKTFSPRNRTAVVAVYFQPTTLLYELIVIDVVEQSEYCRIYVYQSEIFKQLHKRKIAKLAQVKDSDKPRLYSPVQVSRRPDRRRRTTDNEYVSKQLATWQESNAVDTGSDDINLDAIDLRNKAELSSNKDLLTKALVKLLALSQESSSSIEPRFRLINDVTSLAFTTYSSVPEELKGIRKTNPDIPSLISQAKGILDVKDATASLKASVNSAGTYTKHAHSDLVGLNNYGQNSSMTYLYSGNGTKNPNIFKWRGTLQHAISRVMQRNRIAKNARKKWGEVVDNAVDLKNTKLNEISEGKHGPDGEYRRHQVDKPSSSRSTVKLRARRRGIVARGLEGSDECPLTVEEMNLYREEMAERRRLTKAKSEKLLKL